MFKQTEDAFFSALQRASGLPSDNVVWSFAARDQPGLPYLTLNLGMSDTIGIDYIKTTVDETRAAGQEIKQEVKGIREVSLELQAFTAAVSNDGSARDLLERTKAGLTLPSVGAILRTVGVSTFDPGPVNYIPAVVSAGFRGRAVCSVRCYMPAPSVAEYAGYIERVTGTITAKGGQAAQILVPFDVTI